MIHVNIKDKNKYNSIVGSLYKYKEIHRKSYSWILGQPDIKELGATEEDLKLFVKCNPYQKHRILQEEQEDESEEETFSDILNNQNKTKGLGKRKRTEKEEDDDLETEKEDDDLFRTPKRRKTVHMISPFTPSSDEKNTRTVYKTIVVEKAKVHYWLQINEHLKKGILVFGSGTGSARTFGVKAAQMTLRITSPPIEDTPLTNILGAGDLAQTETTLQMFSHAGLRREQLEDILSLYEDLHFPTHLVIEDNSLKKGANENYTVYAFKVQEIDYQNQSEV